MNLHENNLRLEIKVRDIISAISKMLLKKDTKVKTVYCSNKLSFSKFTMNP